MDCCGRPSGRSRIGTFPRVFKRQKAIVAVVLRGDRGLEPDQQLPQVQLPSLRSSFGAIEDWNSFALCNPLSLTSLRSSFGAIEDWNSLLKVGSEGRTGCGRPSGRSRIGTE